MMKRHLLGISAIALALFSVHAVAADAANKPVVKKAQTTADEESKRPQTLKEFPQYNYPVATISKPEVVESQVTESAGPVVDAHVAPGSDSAPAAPPPATEHVHPAPPAP